MAEEYEISKSISHATAPHKHLQVFLIMTFLSPVCLYQRLSLIFSVLGIQKLSSDCFSPSKRHTDLYHSFFNNYLSCVNEGVSDSSPKIDHRLNKTNGR